MHRCSLCTGRARVPQRDRVQDNLELDRPESLCRPDTHEPAQAQPLSRRIEAQRRIQPRPEGQLSLLPLRYELSIRDYRETHGEQKSL